MPISRVRKTSDLLHGEWCPPPLVCPHLWVLSQVLLLSLHVLVGVPRGLAVKEFQYLIVEKQAEEVYGSAAFHVWDHAGSSSEHRRLCNEVVINRMDSIIIIMSCYCE